MRKRNISILFFYFIFVSLSMGQNTFSYPNIIYSGQRVFLESVEIEQGKRGKSKITTKLINTGKDPITNILFTEKKVLLNTHQGVTKMLGDQGLEKLYYSLSAKKWSLAPGKTLELSVNLIKPETTQPEVNQEIAEQASNNKDKKNKKAEIEIEEKKIAEASKKKEKAEQLKMKAEKEIETSKEKVTQAKEKEIEEKKEIEIDVEAPKINKIETPKVDLIETIDSQKEKETTEKTLCSDLMITKLEIIKQTKKAASIRYTITNQGEGVAHLSKRNRDEQNLSVRAFLSSSNKLSRGAITLGGEILKLTAEQETLKSGEQYTGVIRLPLYKLTKFTPYVVLQVDPYQQLIECNETNNVNTINLMNSDETITDQD